MRSSSDEVMRRVQVIYESLLEGRTKSEILRVARNKWEVTDRTIYNYIKRAEKMFEKAAKVHRKREMGKTLNRLERLYNMSSDGNMPNYKLALDIIKEKSKLLGLYPAQGIDVTSGGDKVQGFIIKRAEERNEK